MKAEILSIGTELLVGSILNSDARFLSLRLAENAVDVFRQTTVGDNVERIADALRESLERSDAVVTSGGLGPTEDDVTMRAVGRFLGRPLEMHAPTLAHVKRRLVSRGFRMDKLTPLQCRIPSKPLKVFQNPVGTAPGVLYETVVSGRPRWILVLPGPPRELEPLCVAALPFLLGRAGVSRERFLTRAVRLAGLVEVDVAKKVPDLLKSRPPLTVGIYAKPGEVELKIMCKAKGREAGRLVRKAEAAIRRRFGADVYGVDDETLAHAAGALLKKRGATLGLAESCTGGLVGHLITQTAGSSDYFNGGVVCYANRIKEKFLGVPGAALKKHGSVSPQTAAFMAKGARNAFEASYGVGITGIAGPSGGTKEKPVGLVYVAVAGPRGTAVSRNRFFGTRAEIKSRAAHRALDLLRRALL